MIAQLEVSQKQGSHSTLLKMMLHMPVARLTLCMGG